MGDSTDQKDVGSVMGSMESLECAALKNNYFSIKASAVNGCTGGSQPISTM
jgi:hypothetical protein